MSSDVVRFKDAMQGMMTMLDEIEKSVGYDQDTLQIEFTTAEPHYIVYDRYLHKNVFVGDLEGLFTWLNSQKPS
jgi:hypothetical protein